IDRLVSTEILTVLKVVRLNTGDAVKRFEYVLLTTAPHRGVRNSCLAGFAAPSGPKSPKMLGRQRRNAERYDRDTATRSAPPEYLEAIRNARRFYPQDPDH
ncbi:MAG: hypothetical protein ACREDR_27270, partial [Blastocatellia bacterium]